MNWKKQLNKTKEGIVAGFAVGSILYFLHYQYGYFSDVINRFSPIFQSEIGTYMALVMFFGFVGYIIDDNFRETKFERRLKLWD